MIDRSSPPPRDCACGSDLRWEGRRTSYGLAWLGICASPDCGRFILHGNGHLDLADVLLEDASPLPYAAPWLRLFLRSCRSGEWRVSGQRCWQCDERDL